jgi:hypothetical protein
MTMCSRRSREDCLRYECAVLRIRGIRRLCGPLRRVSAPRHQLIGRHCRYLRPRRWFRSGLAPKRHRRLLTTTTGPVALGSPAGCVVRPDPRLLWPHLRLCRPPGGLWIIPPGCGTNPPAAEGPQFALSVRSPHAAARTPVVPTTARDDAFIVGLPSPHSHRLGHHMSHPSGSGGSRNEAAAFASCYGLEVLQALLRPGRLRSSFHGPGRPSSPRRL